ncbi:uncharacterized protein K02A2.6-like [Ruditapes philippinarum]|uniref:uncharacterized protein K02A2.6-like n=1 Tax=Ruditapes philippinarum TaxID=129788 RepID=UPI00295AE784|nr:uncharacterized protein K02A2.6-like [Ruditapes philippinarum]
MPSLKKKCLEFCSDANGFINSLMVEKLSYIAINKPISAIMKKPMSAAPPRLSRMLLALSKYQLIVKHMPGKEIPVSDCLSRQSLPNTYLNMSDELDNYVHTVQKQLHITDQRIENIRAETCKDAQMKILKKTILNGWPESRSMCKQSILDFWNHRDEISVENDLIFRGHTIVIPKILRNELVQKVHTGHMGITKTLERAKDSIFWPGMSKQITEYVSKCSICLTYRDANTKEPLMTTEFPDRPYQKIAADLFHFQGKEYLLTIDYYSRFFEIDHLQNTTSKTVILKLQKQMSRLSIPEVFVSDNGTQFSSSEFKEFAKEWGFEHRTSSSGYPQSNGLAEKGVGIAKKLMQKAKDTNTNIYIALLEYRNTPLECGYSPSQLLIGRRTKSVVPVTNKALVPILVNNSKVRSLMKQSKDKQKVNYDKNAKYLPPLSLNQSVRIKIGKT